MSYTLKFARALSVAVLIATLSILAFADTIKLKDGSTIKGRILSFTNGQFIILIGTGERQRQMRFFADEIDSIEFDSNPPGISTNASETVRSEPNYSTQTDGSSTIITVGSTSKTPNPQPNTTVVSSAPPNVPTTSGAAVTPIQIKVKVLADNTANGWTNAGWVVRKGQRITIRSNGRISLGNGRYSGPNGISTLPDEKKLIGEKPTGSLIAVIGDDNNDFIFVGEELEFVASRDGALFLGVNEGILDDNSGSFDVTVEIDPRVGT